MSQTDSVKLAIRRLPHSEGLKLPGYETVGSAGMDLRAALEEGKELILSPGERALVQLLHQFLRLLLLPVTQDRLFSSVYRLHSAPVYQWALQKLPMMTENYPAAARPSNAALPMVL